MKKIFLNAALLLLAVSLFGCGKKIQSSGIEVEKVHTVSANISEISFGYAAEVVFTDDIDIDVVEITISDNLLKYLIVKERGSKLIIDLKSWGNIWFRDSDLKIKAHISRYNEIEASGASDIYFAKPQEFTDFKLELSGASTAEGLDIKATNSVEIDMSGASKLTNTIIACSQLDIDISGASTLKKAEITTTDIEVNVAGASSMESQGSIFETMELDCSGASSFLSYDLVCKNVEVELSGASRAEITANGSLRGEASGASTLYYKGEARSSVETSGASTVKYKE